MEDIAQSKEPADAGCRGQRWLLGAQVRHPSEDMRIAAELLESTHRWVIGAEIDKEAAHHDAVVALAGRSECGRQGLDRMGKDRSQGMAEWRTAPAHQEILGWGWMHCAAARAYWR